MKICGQMRDNVCTCSRAGGFGYGRVMESQWSRSDATTTAAETPPEMLAPTMRTCAGRYRRRYSERFDRAVQTELPIRNTLWVDRMYVLQVNICVHAADPSRSSFEDSDDDRCCWTPGQTMTRPPNRAKSQVVCICARLVSQMFIMPYISFSI